MQCNIMQLYLQKLYKTHVCTIVLLTCSHVLHHTALGALWMASVGNVENFAFGDGVGVKSYQYFNMDQMGNTRGHNRAFRYLLSQGSRSWYFLAFESHLCFDKGDLRPTCCTDVLDLICHLASSRRCCRPLMAPQVKSAVFLQFWSHHHNRISG